MAYTQKNNPFAVTSCGRRRNFQTTGNPIKNIKSVLIIFPTSEEDFNVAKYCLKSLFSSDTIKYTYLYFDSHPSGERKLSQFDKNLEFSSDNFLLEMLLKFSINTLLF